MKICMLGAGALGGTLGGVLTEGGHEVWLVDAWKAHVDAMNARGLVLRDGGVDRTVKVRASTDAGGIGPVDVVVVLVKSYDTEAAVRSALAAGVVGPSTVVMSMQNGLGHEEIIGRVVGLERTLAGKTYTGGVVLGPGHLIAGTRGKESIIGELDGSVTERARRIAGAFTAAGLETTVSANIVGTMWDKLFINVGTGALAGITRLTYGDLYREPAIEACALEAIAEAMAVAKALGVKLATERPVDAWLHASAGLPPEFKTSMLQSLEKGLPTEIDYINGSVVRGGERCGVPTPVNRTLVACIKGIERAIAARAPGG